MAQLFSRLSFDDTSPHLDHFNQLDNFVRALPKCPDSFSDSLKTLDCRRHSHALWAHHKFLLYRPRSPYLEIESSERRSPCHRLHAAPHPCDSSFPGLADKNPLFTFRCALPFTASAYAGEHAFTCTQPCMSTLAHAHAYTT
eukprot:6176875-Pleurochrysis_carterae.AAC.4